MFTPLHSRFDDKRTMYWIDPDTKENLDKNWNDRKNRKLLIQNGFPSDYRIEYKIDNYGLRNEDDACVNGSLLTLGCSRTFGIGLAVQNIWPIMLAKKISLSVFNGGICGGSADTAFRILNTLLKSGRPKAVVCLVPFIDRWELILNDRYEMFGPWKFDEMNEHRMLIEAHINEERNSLNQLKNILAMSKLCEDRKIPFVHADSMTHQIRFEDDLARDLAHPGKKWHEAVSEKFEHLYIDKHT